ncbi:MAG: DUF3467 domain-containing protein [Candidatus Cloacimonadota bacterium]|nr:DUF3467 domain-containing protein [Candidatus Cloacimonadota bacterium]
MKKQQQPQKIKINIPKENAEGIYSNLVLMNFNDSEFILDFARILPAVPEAKIYSRIMMNPQHTKRLMKLLQKNIENYEEKYDEIKLPEKDVKKSIGF